MAHTPGPWEYFDAKTEDGEATIGIRVNTEFIATMDVTSVNGGPFVLPPNGEANARLIAAAPELLETLQLIADLDEDYCEYSLWDLRGVVGQYKAAARSAIAQAIGK